MYLVDGSGQFYRAFHAIRGLATSRGLPTNATYGFTTMLRKMLQDEKPEHVAVLFDPPGRTFRHEQYAEYKANRPVMDNDLAVQLPYIRRVCEAFRLPIVEVAGFEADDVIATLAGQAVAAGFKVVIVTADKDMLQLVDGDVVVLNPGREGTGSTRLDRKAVEDKWGVPPERVVDVLALVGDSVDNVPGVPGIGDKGARDLVREYGTVEAVIESADKVKRAAYREGLKAHAAEALLSKQLVTLRKDVPVALDLEAIVCRDPDRAACHALFKELEFQALAKEFAPQVAAGAGDHRLLLDAPSIEAAVAEARAAGRVALGVVVTSAQAVRARPLGIALAWKPSASVYVPLDARGARRAGRARREPRRSRCCGRCWRTRACARPPRTPSATGSCSAGRASRSTGSPSTPCSPSYLIDPGRRGYGLEDLAFEFLGERRSACGDGVASEDAAAGAMAGAAGGETELVLRLDDADLRAARRGGAAPDLRVDGDAARRRARRHGAGRRQGRHGAARRDEPRHGGAARVADRADLRAGEGRVQHQLADPAARGALRTAEPQEREEDRQDARRLDRRGRARGARARPRAAAQDPRLPLGAEAEVDLRRRAARARQPGDRPHPRDVQPGGRGDRAALLDRPEPAEHPDPQRRGPADPRGVRRRAGLPAALRRLQPDRAARARAPLAATRR